MGMLMFDGEGMREQIGDGIKTIFQCLSLLCVAKEALIITGTT